MLFTDGSDLNGVSRTEDIYYIKILKVNYHFLSGWPADLIEGAKLKSNLCKTINRNIIMICYILCLTCEIIYVITNTGRKPLLILGHSYITNLMCGVAMTRYFFIHMKVFRKAVGRILHSIHLFNHRNKSAYYMEIHLSVHKLCHFFSVYLWSMMVMGIIFFNMSPFYTNYSSGAFDTPRPSNVTFAHAMYYSVPFDYSTDLTGYLIVFIFNWWSSFVISITFCATDLLVYLMVFHLWGHLKILIHDLECFPKPSFRSVSSTSFEEPLTFSQLEMNEVKLRLIKCVEHHKLIISSATEMFSTFGWMLAINYCFHQLISCLLLLECSQMDLNNIICYGPLTLLAFQQLFQISLIFELLGSTNDRLSNAVYNLPWECMDQHNKKLVLTFLRQSQRSMYLKAMNMITVGVQTTATILKTSLSYFLMLNTVAKNEN